MKEIKLMGKSYNLPTGWDEVSIGMQIEAEKISSSQTYIKTLGVIAAYTGIPIDILRSANRNEVLAISENLSFINTPLTTSQITEFTYKGEKYSVAETILNQEFGDYVAAQTAIAEYGNDTWKQLSYLVAIMAKKDGEKLDDYDVNKRATHFLDLDILTCNSIAAFFLSNQKASDFIILLSSPEMAQSAVQNRVQQFDHTLNKLKKLRGGNVLIRLWIGISQKYIHYLSHQLEKSFNSSQLKHSKKKWKQKFKRLLSKKVEKETK
jgi:hypothetical protein